MSKSDSKIAHEKACKQNLYFLQLMLGPWHINDGIFENGARYRGNFVPSKCINWALQSCLSSWASVLESPGILEQKSTNYIQVCLHDKKTLTWRHDKWENEKNRLFVFSTMHFLCSSSKKAKRNDPHLNLLTVINFICARGAHAWRMISSTWGLKGKQWISG